MANAAELLRAKAMLLIRREREVHEYRQERTRIQAWLRVFHWVSLNMGAPDTSSLLEEWVRSMVGELSFQVAAVYDCDEASPHMRLLAGLSHRPLPPEASAPGEARQYLNQNASGIYGQSSPPELSALAENLNLGQFYYLALPMRGKNLLFLAGFALHGERLHSTSPQDFSHFVLLGSHLAAILDNAVLLAELDREKSELQASNHQLDINVARLREAQQELVESGRRLAEASRRAGMADIATGVLHNVGNALNSVNVSAEVITERLRGLKVQSVAKLGSLLQQNAGNPSGFLRGDAGARVPAYVLELAKHLVDERDALLKEASMLEGHVEHIKSIVSRQQAYATNVDMSQSCVVSELVDDALSLSEHALSRHGIQIVRDYAAVPALRVDRHKVLQILLNLVKNAKDALLESEQPLKRLIASVTQTDTGRVRISIQDNGIGFAPGEADKLFRFGFTTKKEGHGFGLHTCAISAAELGGSVTASSKGPQQGASFVLELPLGASQRVA